MDKKTYIGTKTLTASPMTRGEYNAYRGWELPADENGEDAGYLVEYEPDGHPNVAGHEGYVSWSPATVFETSYKPANDWYERLLIEHGDLHERLTKLRAFLDSNDYTLLEVPDRDLLQDQYNFMNGYLKILTARSDRRIAPALPGNAEGIEIVTDGATDPNAQNTGLEQSDGLEADEPPTTGDTPADLNDGISTPITPVVPGE